NLVVIDIRVFSDDAGVQISTVEPSADRASEVASRYNCAALYLCLEYQRRLRRAIPAYLRCISAQAALIPGTITNGAAPRCSAADALLTVRTCVEALRCQ